jgi:hypothetical protein
VNAVVLACDGIPADRGPQTVADIAEEFTRRPWHENVECKWSDGSLLLSAESDFDVSGAISACSAVDFGHGIRLVSITAL